jgi:ComF family protein
MSGYDTLCKNCHQQFFEKNLSRCKVCAIRLQDRDNHQICGDCIGSPPGFQHTVVAGCYVAPLDQLVLAFKFGQQLPLSGVFSNLLRDAVLRDPQQQLAQILCAVPLGEQRLRDRGYNQALEIAKPLSFQLGITLCPQLLYRRHDTVPQSSLHPDDRQKNTRNAFALNPDSVELVRGMHIGVIDDVMTTGATLQEIATLLTSFGAKRVSNYVLARTPRQY